MWLILSCVRAVPAAAPGTSSSIVGPELYTLVGWVVAYLNDDDPEDFEKGRLCEHVRLVLACKHPEADNIHCGHHPPLCVRVHLRASRRGAACTRVCARGHRSSVIGHRSSAAVCVSMYECVPVCGCLCACLCVRIAPTHSHGRLRHAHEFHTPTRVRPLYRRTYLSTQITKIPKACHGSCADPIQTWGGSLEC
jgi:hypothetical protein